ncbi:MAG: GAF domain-containing protein [Parcubacteria group bacterium]|nr:GAF domain-containing protein [Parcubacteria group bacterium]
MKKQKYQHYTKAQLVELLQEKESQLMSYQTGEKLAEALEKITQEILTDMSFDELAQIVVDLLVKNIPKKYAGIIFYIHLKDQNCLQSFAFSRTKKSVLVSSRLPMTFQKHKFPLDNTVKNKLIDVVSYKREMRGSDISEFIAPIVNKKFSIWINKFIGIKDILAVPLFCNGEFFGVIQVHGKVKFGDNDIKFIERFSSLQGSLLGLKYNYENLERKFTKINHAFACFIDEVEKYSDYISNYSAKLKDASIVDLKNLEEEFDCISQQYNLYVRSLYHVISKTLKSRKEDLKAKL